MTVHRISDAADLAETVREAGARGAVLEARGAGSKAGFGGWRSGHELLDLSGLTGVIDYDPAELVLTARAGTPVAEIEELVRQSGQMLAFEPMDYGPLLGARGGQSTLGGMIAAAASGPRRVSHGAVRDHLLGFTAVSGAGEVFKAGGKVVKNVTGFDLSKLMAGSWGALAVMTEVTLKVLPAGREHLTLVLRGLDDSPAVAAMGVALRAPAEISGAAHLPAWSQADGHAVTALRLEGFGPSIAARAELLRGLLTEFGALEALNPTDGFLLWRDLVEGQPLDRPGALWRVSLPPAEGAQFTEDMARWGGRCVIDWGGALVWVLGPAGPDDLDAAVRPVAERLGGHAVLVRPNPAAAASPPAFPPPSSGMARLSARVKQAFDPKGVLADRRHALPEPA